MIALMLSGRTENVVERVRHEDGILDAAEIIEARAGVLTPIDPR